MQPLLLFATSGIPALSAGTRGHLPSNRVRLTVEADERGIASRAFDVAAMLDVSITSWFIGGGYRTIEGGADIDTVYNFSRLNAAVVRTGVTF